MWDEWLHEKIAVLLPWPGYSLSNMDTRGIFYFQLLSFLFCEPVFLERENSFAVFFISKSLS